MMRIVVITPPHAVPREAATIRLLLDAGIDRVHIRKPEATQEELCALLEAIPEPLRPRLSLHDGHCLATRYGIGGVHLNTRNPLPPEGFRGVVSRSCHSFDELAADTACSYRFLSPIFDSISKNGYRAAFTAEALRTAAARGAARRPDAGPGRHHARPPCGRARLRIRRRGPAGFDLAAALTRITASDHRQNHRIQKLITTT